MLGFKKTLIIAHQQKGRNGYANGFFAASGIGSQLGQFFGRIYVRFAKNEDPVESHYRDCLLFRRCHVFVYVDRGLSHKVFPRVCDRKARRTDFSRNRRMGLIPIFQADKRTGLLIARKTLLNLEVKSLGIVIHILRKPTSADIDRSGTINGIEALLLGFALSIDAFGAGIGAAILGFSPITLSFAVAIMSSLFVSIGIYAGHVLSKWSWIDKMAFLPGLLLITIGLWKL